MHIAEGVLSPQVLAAGAAIAVCGLAIGIKKMRESQIPLCGVMAAVFFLASLIHVPIGVTSAHLLLAGLTGIILGWAAFPAIFTGLFLQALLFQYGGLTTLGVNVACMGGAAICAWKIFTLFAAKAKSAAAICAGAFAAGFAGVAVAALLTAASLSFTSEGFRAAAAALFLAHLPIMIVEGLITMLTVGFLARYRPEVINLSSINYPDIKLCAQK